MLLQILTQGLYTLLGKPFLLAGNSYHTLVNSAKSTMHEDKRKRCHVPVRLCGCNSHCI